MLKVDFHIHSRYSDSSRNVEDILKIADKRGLDYISITDHDNADNLKEIEKLKGKFKVKIIKGIEISAFDYKRNRKVHILGYGFEKIDNIKKICDGILERRNDKSIRQVEILKSMGYKIEKENLKGAINSKKTLYKQHIMDCVCGGNFNDKRFNKVYKLLFNNSGPLNIDIEYVDIYKALDAILSDGGIPIIAHPGQLDSFEISEELAYKGLRGIEVNHVAHTKEEIKRSREIAKKYNLIESYGSDNHGYYGRDKEIGYEVKNPSELMELINLWFEYKDCYLIYNFLKHWYNDINLEVLPCQNHQAIFPKLSLEECQFIIDTYKN